MSFETLYWREPLFILSIFLPLIIILLVHYRQKKIWQQLADPHLLPWLQASSKSSRQLLSKSLLAIAWVLFSIALAGPRTPQWIPPSLQADDVSIITIVDFSRSMNAKDGNKNRIVQAQILLKHWLKLWSKEGSASMRMGLIIYAGHSHTLLKPTHDKALIQHYIEQLHQFRPPTLGNNLAASLQTASDLLKDTKGQRYILLLSDGDLGDKASDAAGIIAAQLKNENLLKINIIGVGKSEAVRVPAAMNEPLIVDGKSIVSARQSGRLKKIASQSGGVYQSAESVAQLNLKQALHLAESRIDPEHNHQILWDEWFFIPLLGGILFCLLALLSTASTAIKLFTTAFLFTISGCELSVNPLADNTKATNIQVIRAINAALDSADYAQVRRLAENNNGYDYRFAEGVACYRLKDYPCAREAFSTAAWSAADDTLRGRAVFNLANTHYRLADYDQASVLFNDAQQLGIDKNKTLRNRQFSDSLAAAVEHRIAQIARSKQRAQWRESARILTDDLSERIADLSSQSSAQTKNSPFYNLSISQQNSLIAQGVKRKQNRHKNNASLSGNFWVRSNQDNLPQQTSGLFNSLMPIEIGIHYVPDKPLAIQGQRSW